MWAEILSAILGQSSRDIKDQQKLQMLQGMMQRIKDMKAPDLERLTPEQLGSPESANVDPALQAAQMAALGRLGQWGEGKATASDQANMSLMQDEAARRGQVQQQAIVNRAQQTGQLGGGAQLAMQQQAAQNQNQAAYAAALQNMKMLQDRAMQATQAQGGMAGQMSQADFRRKAARDEAARWNAMSRAGAAKYNADRGQVDFQNKMQLENALANRSGLYGNALQEKGQSEANMWGNLGAAVGTGMGGKGGGGEDEDGEIYNLYTDNKSY